MAIPRWARGPFELLVQAELHYRAESESDKRLALIAFDNAVEISIVTYLHLHPEQRGGKQLVKDEVEVAGKNFHTLLDMFFKRCVSIDPPSDCSKAELIHYHRVRNEQYHGGTLNVPGMDDIEGVRSAARWIFATLFDVDSFEQELTARIELLRPPLEPRNDLYDHLIDQSFDEVEVGVFTFSCSEVLFAVDREAYRELGLELTIESGAKSGRKKSARVPNE